VTPYEKTISGRPEYASNAWCSNAVTVSSILNLARFAQTPNARADRRDRCRKMDVLQGRAFEERLTSVRRDPCRKVDATQGSTLAERNVADRRDAPDADLHTTDRDTLSRPMVHSRLRPTEG
jgi:hypothetical protein